ncbi:MAG: hypothetical protein LBH20_09360 [Treponema sp.]|jgi:hypothetical protein|nr:hypothetical protein [Treponema sp.]
MWDQIWEFVVQNVFNVIIVIGIVFLIFGPKKFHKFSLGKQGIEFQGIHDPGCGELQQKHEAKLSKIEKILEDDIQERKKRQAYVDKEFTDLKANDEKTWEVLLKVSEDNQYNLFINKEADIVERLKAFRILIAFERNGDVKKQGFELILQNKNGNIDPWRQAQKYKLPVPIKNQKYWDETMEEIERRIYDGF